jgi:hypothetical protein
MHFCVRYQLLLFQIHNCRGGAAGTRSELCRILRGTSEELALKIALGPTSHRSAPPIANNWHLISRKHIVIAKKYFVVLKNESSRATLGTLTF